MNIEISSGNVFADLECSNPAALLLQSELMIALRKLAQNQQWSSLQLSQQLTIPPDRAHQLLHGSINDFTLEEIVELATGAGIRTEIILPSPISISSS
jgi:predicted XRE-type DNA-binding protein